MLKYKAGIKAEGCFQGAMSQAAVAKSLTASRSVPAKSHCCMVWIESESGRQTSICCWVIWRRNRYQIGSEANCPDWFKEAHLSEWETEEGKICLESMALFIGREKQEAHSPSPGRQEQLQVPESIWTVGRNRKSSISLQKSSRCRK